MPIAKTNYTNRDYDNFMVELEDFIKAKYPKIWNDLYESNAMKVSTEVGSYTGDNLAFFQDFQFNEGKFVNCQERINMVAHAKMLGYELRSPSAALVVLTATCEAFTGTCTLVRGTKIKTDEADITFTLPEESILTGTSGTTFSLNAVQADVRNDMFFSTGQTWQKYRTGFPDVAYNDTLAPVIRVDGVVWTKVKSLWAQTAGNFYEGTFTGDLYFSVLFGDGVHGSKPGTNATVTIDYFTTKGAEGNKSVDKVSDTITGTLSGGGTLNFSVTNPADANGGEEEESVEEARKNAPLYYASAQRCVTADDFKVFALKYPGIIKASVMIYNAMKIVTLYPIATGWVAPNQTLKDNLAEYIRALMMVGTVLRVEDPTFIPITITGTIYYKPTILQSQVLANVTSNLQEFFYPSDPSMSENDLGRDIRMSDIISLLQNTDGVEYLDLGKLSCERAPLYDVWHGSGIIANIETLTSAIPETWTIAFTSPTAFSVTGSVTGLQTNTGTVGTTYVTDQPMLRFLITAGTSPYETADRARIVTSYYKGNVNIEDNEYGTRGVIAFNYIKFGTV